MIRSYLYAVLRPELHNKCSRTASPPRRAPFPLAASAATLMHFDGWALLHRSASVYHRAMAFSVPAAFVVLCLYNEAVSRSAKRSQPGDGPRPDKTLLLVCFFTLQLCVLLYISDYVCTFLVGFALSFGRPPLPSV